MASARGHGGYGDDSDGDENAAALPLLSPSDSGGAAPMPRPGCGPADALEADSRADAATSTSGGRAAALLDLCGGWGPFQHRLLLYLSFNLGIDAMVTILTVFIGRTPRAGASSSVDGASYVSEFGLLGPHAWQAAAIQSGFFVGYAAGAVIAGRLSDTRWLGRCWTGCITTAVAALGVAAIAAAPSAGTLAAAVALAGAGVGGKGLSLYALGCESVGDAHRSLFVSYLWSFWAAYAALLPLIAMAVDATCGSGHGAWRRLAAAVALLEALPLLGWATSYVPESPRFLVHDPTAALALFRRVARANGRVLSESAADELAEQLGASTANLKTAPHQLGAAGGAGEADPAASKAPGPAPPATGGVAFLLSSRLFLGHTVWLTSAILIAAAFCSAQMYFGLALAAGRLSGSLYLNSALNSLIQIPGSLCIAMLVERVGRRASLAATLGAGAAVLLALPALGAAFGVGPEGHLPPAMGATATALALAAELFAGTSFSIVFIVIVEVLPLEARTAGVAACSFAARMGGIAAPLLLLGGPSRAQLGYGGLAGAAAVLCMWGVPETLGVPME